MLFPTLPHQTNEILVEVHSIARRSTSQVGWYLQCHIPPNLLEGMRMCEGSWRRAEMLQTAAGRARKSFWWVQYNFYIFPISGLPELQRAEVEALRRSFDLSILQIFLIIFIHSNESASHLLFPPAALLGLSMEEEYFCPNIYDEVNWFIIHFFRAPEVIWTEVGVFEPLLSLVYYGTRICYFPLSHTKRMKY